MNDGNRICYVDPNDVRGNINGKPLTPDYTEFNIACYLYVEKNSRAMNQVAGDNVANKDLSVAYNLTEPGGFLSVMRGKDFGGHNFLTTDYINIDYNEVKDRTIIEGLQMESVNISFTNYQTPQITIKFVDIRGGGFFGREEATHNEYGNLSNLSVDENNNLIDNFFSCFVSFPYPKFKLQVKGFYGKAVTYQLTCTSFNGNFNSATGNFEIVVQFIGYEYGMLGDIPFELLVQAPYTSYGRDYWAKHENSPEWQLDKNGAEKPIKLKEFFHLVKSEMDDNSSTTGNNATDINTTTVVLGYQTQIQNVQKIITALNDFKTAVKNAFESRFVVECTNDEENVLVVFHDSGLEGVLGTNSIIDENVVPRITQEMCDKRNELKKLIQDYNRNYASEPGGAISEKLIPNFGNKQDNDWKIDSNKVTSQKLLFNNKNISILTGLILPKIYNGDNIELVDGFDNILYDNLNKLTWFHQNIDFKYVFAIDCGKGVNELNQKVLEIDNAKNDILYNFESAKMKDIQNILHISPFIGRYYKVVMCHLETFVALFDNCAKTIYNQMLQGYRAPQRLGITNLDTQTDAPSRTFSKGVPPFPAVYQKYSTVSEAESVLNDKSGNIVKNVWIGDFPGDWEEKKLVNEFYENAQIVSTEGTNTALGTFNSNTGKYDGCDFDPFTFIYEGIPNYAYSSIDGALLFIGLQLETTLHLIHGGKLDDEKAKKLGEYNAYIFAKKEPLYIYNIVEQLNKEESNLANFLYNSIVYCTEFANQDPFKYEFIHNKHKGRHPVFTEDNNKVKYSYTTAANNKEFIPTKKVESLQNSNPIATDFKSDGQNNTTPYVKTGDYFIVNGSDNKYIGECTGTKQFEIYNTAQQKNVNVQYNSFKIGNTKVGNKNSKEYDKVVNWFGTETVPIKNSIDKYKSFEDQNVDLSELLNTNFKNNFTLDFIY